MASMKPRVAVLYNVSQELKHGEARDMIADQGVIHCAQAISEALQSGGYAVERLPFSGDVEDALRSYPPTKWLIFNLAEGMDGRLFEEPRIAWALEAMGYSFTGSGGDALARTLHKGRTKTLLCAHGVDTPEWVLLRDPDEVDGLPRGMQFPLIVKPMAEDASQGLDSGAVVRSVEELKARVAYIAEQYRQVALVEQFIDGREFNVAIWGKEPHVLPLAEIDFSAFSATDERIVSFAAKWEEGSFEYDNTPAICPAQVTPLLGRRIQRSALRAWQVLGCRGYARVDMRIDRKDNPYVIEVNCNPDLSPEAGFARAARVGGFDYQQMAAKIVELARGS